MCFMGTLDLYAHRALLVTESRQGYLSGCHRYLTASRLGQDKIRETVCKKQSQFLVLGEIWFLKQYKQVKNGCLFELAIVHKSIILAFGKLSVFSPPSIPCCITDGTLGPEEARQVLCCWAILPTLSLRKGCTTTPSAPRFIYSIYKFVYPENKIINDFTEDLFEIKIN